jgi:hypothetical protein
VNTFIQGFHKNIQEWMRVSGKQSRLFVRLSLGYQTQNGVHMRKKKIDIFRIDSLINFLASSIPSDLDLKSESHAENNYKVVLQFYR